MLEAEHFAGCYMSDLEGVMLSDYLLLQCISRGGMADVYRARQKGEGNYEVAVKIFRSSYAQRESFREYFMAEAEKIGQFDHPNILPLLEYGEGEGLLYIVTPFVTGGTLEDLLRRVGGKFSSMLALPIIQQLCSAVQYAHNHDVVHGNIKPSNVFVAADGRMLLADFGIAHSYDDSQQSLTRVGWGSAEYVAPEQSLGLLRRASDIYSLGVLLFRILTGQPPFTGQTPVEVLLKHVRVQPPSARTLVPTISDAVDDVLQMALQKRSDDRFASADEFSNAFLLAVTVAPVASPVARPIVTRKLQLVPGDVAANNRHTPLPVSHYDSSQPPAVVEPQTPLPAYLALAPQIVPSEMREASPSLSSPPALPPSSSLPPLSPVLPLTLSQLNAIAAKQAAEPGSDDKDFMATASTKDAVSYVDAVHVGGSADAAEPMDAEDITDVMGVASTSDSAEIGQKDFLQEDDNDFGSQLFWSVDPVEWSPLARQQAHEHEPSVDVPLTASEYLDSKPPIAERRQPEPRELEPPQPEPRMAESQIPVPVMASSPVHIPETHDTLTPPTMPEKEEGDKGKGTWNERLKKILPVVVVILLLLGLLAALLSSFLLPGDPGAGSGQTISTSVATIGLMVNRAHIVQYVHFNG